MNFGQKQANVSSSPLRWYGAKSKYWPRIRPYLPPHTTWVDVFGGSGVCTLARPRSEVEIYNEINPLAANFWRIVKSNPLQLQSRLRQIVPTTEAFYATVNTEYDDPIESAAMFYVRQRLSYNGETFRTVNPCCGIVNGEHKRQKIAAYHSKIEKIPLYSQRMRDVVISNQCFSSLLTKYDSPTTLHYNDPPYNKDMRSSGTSAYDPELTDEQHEQMLKMLLQLKGYVVLSGYDFNFKYNIPNTLYRDYLSSWYSVHIPLISAAAQWTQNKGIKYREECIWINPQGWDALQRKVVVC